MRLTEILATALVSTSAVAESAEPIASVLVHPPFASYYVCGEHRQGQLNYLGDALGTDCFRQELIAEGERSWAVAYRGDGTRNTDWYSWRAELLSPCDCMVKKVHINPDTNQPGLLGKPPASMIVFERSDGVHLLMAHVREVVVVEGESVGYGQVVAKVGNNGYGRNPHVHMGAWKGDSALQIRFDLAISEKGEAGTE